MTNGFQLYSSSGAIRHIPGQLELIDNGISSASDSDTWEKEASTATPTASVVREPADKPCKPTLTTASRGKGTLKPSPVRVALRRYAVTKSETLQHLYEHWYPLLTARWPQNVQGAANALAECNSLIGIQRRWLSNYECALMFRHFANDASPDPERLRCMLGLLLRWWFCGKFAVHLAQFPHLGNEAVLVNAAYGMLSSPWTQARLVLQLLDGHDSIGELLHGVLIHPPEAHGTDHAIDAASCNSLLLKVLPILKRGLLEPDLGPACSKATQFIEEMGSTALALRFDRGFKNERLDLRPECRDDDKVSLVEQLWSGILRCNIASLQVGQSQRCDCHGRMTGILLSLMSHATSIATNGSTRKMEECRQLSTRRLIGYFAKWVVAKTGNTDDDATLASLQGHTDVEVVDNCAATGLNENNGRLKQDAASQFEGSDSSCGNNAIDNCSTLNRSARLLLNSELVYDCLKRVDECAGMCDDLVFNNGTASIKEEPDVDKSERSGTSIGLNTGDTFVLKAFGNIWDRRNAISDPVDRACITLLAGAILMIEDSHLKGDVILDEGYSRPLVASKLSQIHGGQEIVDKVLNCRRFYTMRPSVDNSREPSQWTTLRAEHRMYPVDSTGFVDNEQPPLLHYFGDVHRALCEAAGVCPNNARFIPALMLRDGSTSSTRNHAEFKMCTKAAYRALEGLWQALQQGETCSANISLEVGDADCGRSVSAPVYAVVALVSLMGGTVVLQTGDAHVGIIRVAVILGRDNDFAPNDYGEDITYDHILNLTLRLLYTDIATDASMALDYHSSQLTIYRTLLVHYLRKALLKPTRQAFDMAFTGKRSDNFDAIFRRILRLTFFRVHIALVDRPKFESFLRTRVEYSAPNDTTDNEGDFLEEINSGYIELGGDNNRQKASSDSDVEFDNAIDHRIFGFLEYSRTHRVSRRMWNRFIKSECGDAHEEMKPRLGSLDRGMLREPGAANSADIGSSKGMPDTTLLFFESVFELCGQMRFCVDEDQLFRHNKVDRLLYQLFLHICHIDKGANIQRNYETNVLCKIKQVHETDEYGEVDSERSSLDSLTWEEQGGLDMTSGGPTAGEQPAEEEKGGGYVNLDVLFLGRQKFTKRSYYVLSRLAIESLVRWLSPESAASAVCRWASSVPIDTTSRVKAYKPATASAIVTMLSLSMLCHVALPSAEELPLQKVESLVSAANVCFVNLTVSFTAAATIPDAVEVLCTDEEEDSEHGDICSVSHSGAEDVEHTGSNIKIKEEPNETFGTTSKGKRVERTIRVKRERTSISDDLCQHSVNKHPCADLGSTASTDDHSVTSEFAEGAWYKTRSYVPGGLQLWKDHKIREHRARQLRLMRLRNNLRKSLIEEGVHLLQICVVFVHILGHVVLQTADCLLDPQNGYVTTSNTAGAIQDRVHSDAEGEIHDSNDTSGNDAPSSNNTNVPVMEEGAVACPPDMPSLSLTSFTSAEDGWVTPPCGNRRSPSTSPKNVASESRPDAENTECSEGQQSNCGAGDERTAQQVSHRTDFMSNEAGLPLNPKGTMQPIVETEGDSLVSGDARDPARGNGSYKKDSVASDSAFQNPNLNESSVESQQAGRECREEQSFQHSPDINAVDYLDNIDTNASHEICLSTDPKMRSKFDCVMQFLGLACNTLDSLFGACSTVSRCCVGDDLDVAIWDNDRMMKAAEEELELLLHEISFLRDQVEAHIAPLQEMHAEATLTDEYPSAQDPGAGRHLKYPRTEVNSDDDEAGLESEGGSSDVDCSGAEDDDDDLGSFVDFETDKHLGMVTFRRSNKRTKASSRLRDVILRSEWNCLIKSYLA
ncbi:gp25 baseplate wedge subunit, putative [Babesia ovata]|uniref:Gp25 baseplate wedge subunit, putative n=1 Tax=Babesia ovata TaxID=189622 RepID=A0A2H6KGS8_9APIC|nr:gp25 baseplate wedge subunit, putative [Babesia ovata]GBE62203.1 gp25 baseplate wedge subunit, putative [Babesia ovata]